MNNIQPLIDLHTQSTSNTTRPPTHTPITRKRQSTPNAPLPPPQHTNTTSTTPHARPLPPNPSADGKLLGRLGNRERPVED